MSSARKIRKLKPGGSLEERFEEIYQNHFEHLFVFACTIAKDKELAKDIVSDVFVELWSNKAQIDKIREIESYLFISVKNHTIRVVSRRSNQNSDIDIDNTLKNIDRINPEEVLLEKELHEFIEATVSALPDQCQLVFRMAKDKQLKYSEIAEELGISLATVKSQLVKATAIVKTAILEKFEDRDDATGYNKLGMASLLLMLSLLV